MTATTTAPGFSPWRVLGVTSIGVFIVFLDTTIVNVAFNTIQRDLHASRSGLSWVLNAYALVFAALLIPAGSLADRVGRRRMFTIGLAGFAVTSALCGLSPDIGVLVAARALQACFGALIVPTSLALLLPAFPIEKRSTAVGLWGAMGAIAAASGPTLGALLIRYVDWRAVFLVNVPFCAVAFVLARRSVPESLNRDATVPAVPGVLLAIAGPAALALGVVEGPTWGWSDPRILSAFAVAAVLLAVFVTQCRTSSRPVIDPKLFSVGSYTAANVGTLLFATAFYSATLGSILYLQSVWQWSVLKAALAVTPSPLLAAAVAGPAGKLADRYGHRVVLVPGALIFAAGQLQLALRVTASPHYASVWLPAALTTGVGIGLTLPTLGSAAARSLPPERFGIGAAVNATFRQFGGVLGVSVFVAVLGTPGLRTVVESYHHTWLVTAGLSAAAALVSLAITRVRHEAAPPASSTERPRGVLAASPA